jgi:hypothetical protein
MSIRPLPPDVVAQIKSSTTITSLNGVVCELIKNSLDAGSTRVDINVDYARGGGVVEDDGWGILPSEFRESGGLGKPHRELNLVASHSYLTRNRHLEIKLSGSSPWSSRNIPCLSVSHGFAYDHISPPPAPLAQHSQHA